MNEKDWDWDLIWRISEMDCENDSLSKWHKTLAKALLDINERLKKLEKPLHYKNEG